MGKVKSLFKSVYKPIFGGAADLLGGLFGSEPKAPDAPPPPQFDQMEAYKAAQAAALLKKKGAQAAFGYEDTVKTGSGLAGIGGAYQGGKTLTGS